MKNKHLLSGLASALVVSVICALSVSQASEPGSEASPAAADAPAEVTDPSVEKVGEQQAEAAEPSLTKFYSHKLAGKAAVTLYVRDIPVVTFLGDKAQAEATKVAEQGATASADQISDPMWRATTVAAKINQLQPSSADTVRVVWDKKQKTYVIRIQDQQLLAMNSETLLPKTTKDVAEDALQITNLIRRQVGNAAPLTTIPGRPKPKIAKPKPVTVGAVRSTQRGQASWYGGGFHGRKTASGERYNQYALTAAHKRLRFGTRVRVTNLRNGRSVIVRINDRGPFIRGRIIDLSRKGAQAIGMIGSGVAPVKVEVLR